MLDLSIFLWSKNRGPPGVSEKNNFWIRETAKKGYFFLNFRAIKTGGWGPTIKEKRTFLKRKRKKFRRPLSSRGGEIRPKNLMVTLLIYVYVERHWKTHIYFAAGENLNGMVWTYMVVWRVLPSGDINNGENNYNYNQRFRRRYRIFPRGGQKISVW